MYRIGIQFSITGVVKSKGKSRKSSSYKTILKVWAMGANFGEKSEAGV